MEMIGIRVPKWKYYSIAAFLGAALILSVISYLELCSAECKASHDWKLFGFSMAPFGIAFFSTLLILHLSSIRFPVLFSLAGLGVMAALGAEAVLIYVQKYRIGHWCPVCLGIAVSVLLASLIYIASYYKNIKKSFELGNKGDIMRKITFGTVALTVFFLGLFASFLGISKVTQLQALQESVKEKIVFGSPDAKVKLYLFTDWACPACRAIEPKLKQILPAILKKDASLTFVDLPVHPETLNFTPYNLAFMVNNKDKYIALRDDLTELSTETGTPTEDQIRKITKNHGFELQELNFSDIAMGLKYYKELAKQYDVDATPTLIIVNQSAKKGKKLAGNQEITKTNVLKAIDAVSK